MKKCVKHFAQVLYSILSAVSATVSFYLISGLALRNSTQDTGLTVLDIITAFWHLFLICFSDCTSVASLQKRDT